MAGAKRRHASTSSEILCSTSAASETKARTMEISPQTVSQAPQQGLTHVNPVSDCLRFLQPLSAGPLPTWKSPQQQNLFPLKTIRPGRSNTKTPAIVSNTLLVPHCMTHSQSFTPGLSPVPPPLDKQVAAICLLDGPAMGFPVGQS